MQCWVLKTHGTFLQYTSCLFLFADSFFCFFKTPRKTNKYPLRITGWKMIHVLLKWSLFGGRIRSFSGGYIIHAFDVCYGDFWHHFFWWSEIFPSHPVANLSKTNKNEDETTKHLAGDSRSTILVIFKGCILYYCIFLY